MQSCPPSLVHIFNWNIPFGEMTDSDTILITAGPYQFLAKFELQAPETSALFRELLPYRQKLIHVRWSGEGLWIPLGEKDFGISFENHTAHPSAGQILLYPGGISETEFLFCYGGVAFASKMGPLAANHFLTVIEGNENLRALGELVLWKGAQDVIFEVAHDEQSVKNEYGTATNCLLWESSLIIESRIRQFRKCRSSKL